MRACDPIVTPSIVLALCLAVLAPPLMASSRVAADKHPVLVRSSQVHPELVDGEPAPTRLREDVAFLLTSTPDTYRQPKAAEDVTCRALLAAPLPSDRRIALNSPFRALDAGEPPAAQ